MKFIRKRKIESKEAIQKSVTQVSFALMHYIAKWSDTLWKPLAFWKVMH